MKKHFKLYKLSILLLSLFLATALSFAQPSANSNNQNKAEEYFKQGQIHWKNLDITDAIASYTKALEIQPNYTDALRERGTIYFLISENELAVKDLNIFLKTEPNHAKILNYRGSALANIAAKLIESDQTQAASKAQESLADFNKAIELNPDDSSFFNGRGKLLFDFGYYKEAISDFEKSLKLSPKGQYAFAYLGYSKFAVGAGSGLGELSKALEIDPKLVAAYYLRGNIYRQTGLLKESLQDYNKAIELNDYNAEYYNVRGLTYFFLEEGYEAVKDFSQAISIRKDFGLAYFYRGMTYKKYPYSVSDDPTISPIAKIPLQRRKMLADFSSAILYNPNIADAYIERGLMNSTIFKINLNGPDAETVKQLNIALADFEQAVKLNGKSAEAYNGRASCYKQLGKKDLALADYNKAIELNPKLETAYMGRMGIYCEMGKKELSIADENKVKELGFAIINVCNLGN